MWFNYLVNELKFELIPYNTNMTTVKVKQKQPCLTTTMTTPRF